jgi:HlyD family secretion protein
MFRGSEMKKKVVMSGALVVVLIVAGYFVFFGGRSRKYDFRFDKVSKGDLTVFVTATGTINAVTSVDVGTQVSGIVSKLYADFNSVVKQGQIIAQIDSTFLVQSVKDAQASLEKAKAQYADSKRNFEREKVLLEKGLDSQLNYDAALTAYESNSAALKSAEASLDRAKINLAYATIFAPISGVVINRAVNVGQTVAASFSSPTLYTIANDLSKMQVQATVDESDIGRISIGQQATFSVDAYPDEKFTGIVSQIRLAPVSIQNVVNYTVIIDVNNDQLKLMPGMTANVRVEVADGRDVLRVPNMALRFQPPGDLVDSTKIQAQRDALAGRMGMGDDTARARSLDGAWAGAEANGRSTSGGRGWGGSDSAGSASGKMAGRQEQIGKLRDSIMAAHGGNMSREDLMGEMRKVFMNMRGGEGQARPATRQPATRPPGGAKFGITNIYPEYQKSAYVPSHQAGRGRIWMLNSSGKLQPVFVRTGVTDGRFTEITSDEVKPGDQIVMGVSSNSETTGGQTQNPLTGQGQRPMGGMR